MRSRASQSGFTLLEVLLATAITAVLVAAMLGMVGQFLDTWRTASDRLSTEAQARMALDFVARDLEGVWLEESGIAEDRVWLAYSGAGNSAHLRMVTYSPEGGGMRLVAYWMESVEIFQGSGHAPWQLMRAELDLSNEADFEDYLGPLVSATAVEDLNPGGLVPSGDDARNFILASNVIELSLACFVRNEDQTYEAWQAEGASLRIPDGTQRRSVPDYAEVRLTVLSADGADALRLLEEGIVSGADELGLPAGGSDWERVKARFGRTYQRRIDFRTAIP